MVRCVALKGIDPLQSRSVPAPKMESLTPMKLFEHLCSPGCTIVLLNAPLLMGTIISHGTSITLVESGWGVLMSRNGLRHAIGFQPTGARGAQIAIVTRARSS
jgi:hypothetical protein